LSTHDNTLRELDVLNVLFINQSSQIHLGGLTVGKVRIFIAVFVMVLVFVTVVMVLKPSEPRTHGYTVTYPAEHKDETFELGSRSSRDYPLSSKGQYHIAVSASGTVDIEVYSRGELVDRKPEMISTTLDFFNESQAIVVRIINGAWLGSRTVRIVIDKDYYEEWVSG
jgi:hypothetical protein